MKNLIINNPYRILGVYVGDSPAAEQKNLARFRAFEKVGQTYEVSLVGEEDLPKIKRTEKLALGAAQLLSLPADRIKYSFLWFSDGTTEWGKTLNDAVRALVKGNYSLAIEAYNKLITNESLREAYVSAVTHGVGNASMAELSDILGEYFKQDNGFKDFLYNSSGSGNSTSSNITSSNSTSSNNTSSNITSSNSNSDSQSIPSCFLTQWIYRGALDENIKKSVKTLEDLAFGFNLSIDFYKSLDNLKKSYAEIEKEISICRSIFGVGSIEYQEYAVQVVKEAYQVSTRLESKVGEFLWNQKFKDKYQGYKQYQTKMLTPVIKECMRLIKEIDDELNKFIDALQLSHVSQTILYSERQTYLKHLSWEYVTDQKVLRKANRKFLITRGIIIGAWLTLVISIIISTMN